ncbi:amidohydrolase, partial [Steroidobacter sp.]|uniref:amidohydrolase n=1 Tax=Steroidobacter sp. TaxID=1978227 RepID=UPI001A62572D
MLHSMRVWVASSSLLLTTAAVLAAQPGGPAADRVYRNGVIFTADAGSSQAQALAVREGRIVYVGAEQGVAPHVGKATVVVDLKGRFLMPGLVDGHMHPGSAGATLLKCSLNYESLTVPELQQRVQACLDKTRGEAPNAWLEVVNWFQENMRPTGVVTSHATLDALQTKRPIIVRSSFGHTVLANSRALKLANITAATVDPPGGKIWRDAKGEPTGLLEDAAFEGFAALLPKSTPAQDVEAVLAALAAMNKQGVTSFLDAAASREDVAAFATVRKNGKLTARAHFAPPIEPAEVGALDKAVARVVSIRKQFDEGPISRAPGITVRNAKLFMDGVISAPALTGAMLEPYRQNTGTTDHPKWGPGTSRGPDVYFPPEALANVLTALGRAGIDPHLHADGDAAVRAALDGIAALRKALPGASIRPAIAHNEIIAAADLPRFKALDATPVLSFQWQKPAGDTLGLKDYFGPERMKALEPAGRLAAAGARIAFGSDWPV